MYYIESPSTNPYFNLALEQYVFDQLDRANNYFMLWQNDSAIIVGKHQNTLQEINHAYVKERGIQVVRRLSGGGTVYHDMGNINFTFVTDAEGEAFDFATFCRPVIKALARFEVPAKINGRNDMTIGDQKFSGNAQYRKQGRVMHHGTLMYDSQLDVLEKVLTVSADKILSKGLKSVRSRVTNIKPHMRQSSSTAAFFSSLREFMFEEYNLQPYLLREEDLSQVQVLRETVYDHWEWNYGASPACEIYKERRVEGCGKLEVHMDVKNGTITKLAFCGDYFGCGDSDELVRRLLGCPLEDGQLRAALAGVAIGTYFNNMDIATFCEIMTQ